MKPPVDLAEFQGLDLRVETVAAIRLHPSLPGLSILTLDLGEPGEPVEALAPGSAAGGLEIGVQVVVARGFHPLQAGQQRFTASLVSGPVTSRIPNGSRLT